MSKIKEDFVLCILRKCIELIVSLKLDGAVVFMPISEGIEKGHLKHLPSS